jgi:hypothetical protein
MVFFLPGHRPSELLLLLVFMTSLLSSFGSPKDGVFIGGRLSVPRDDIDLFHPFSGVLDSL